MIENEKTVGDTVEVYCEYCKITHYVTRKNYERNIKRNVPIYGRYICGKEGGSISGSLPKPHLIKDNPYADEGKKQCNGCGEILLFECFSPDKTKKDGYCTRCKTCRAEKNKEAYQNKQSKKLKETSKIETENQSSS